VLASVRAILIDVIGPEYAIDLSIEMETAFDADLGLESIEFVAVAERLQDLYGRDVDFIAWLATKELDEIIALTVGDLVTFIAASMSDRAEEHRAPA
jgi:acyl carrier protein